MQIYKEKVNNLEDEVDASKVLNWAGQKELGLVNNDNKALIEEYKGKNDTLNSLVTEYKTAKVENENLKNRLSQSILSNIKINNEKINKAKEVEQLNASMADVSKQSQELKLQSKSDKEELVYQHKLDILSLKVQSKEEANKLSNRLQESKQQYKIDMETLKDQQKSDIEKSIQDIIKSKDAEKREVIITLKEEQQVKLQSTQDEYNKA